MSKKYVVLIFLGILLVGTITFVASQKIFAPKKIHYHAGFIVFENNKKIDFSDNKYMYIKPCSVNGKENNAGEDNQLEKAHLHDNVGDVVHIETNGAVWKDLFSNIKYAVDYGKTTGYINGKKIENYQSHSIKTDDTLAVFIGNNDINTDLKQTPKKDYIEAIGKKSTICGD